MRGTCDVCGNEREEWETHNYWSGLTICKKDVLCVLDEVEDNK